MNDPSPDDNDQSFLGFASRNAIQGCAANGVGDVDSSNYCDKVSKQDSLQNPYKLTGYRLYFHWIQTTYNNVSRKGTSKDAIVGPVFVYDVSKQTNNKLRDIEIGGVLDDRTNVDPSILDTIGNSLRFSR